MKTNEWLAGASPESPKTAGQSVHSEITAGARLRGSRPTQDLLAAGNSARRGFTLIELLVVIAIIAILASMFLPALAINDYEGKLLDDYSLAGAPGRHAFAGDGRLFLYLNGRAVAEGRAPGTLANQPADGFTVGSDGNASVGDYEAPNAFAGKVENVRVLVL